MVSEPPRERDPNQNPNFVLLLVIGLEKRILCHIISTLQLRPPVFVIEISQNQLYSRAAASSSACHSLRSASGVSQSSVISRVIGLDAVVIGSCRCLLRPYQSCHLYYWSLTQVEPLYCLPSFHRSSFSILVNGSASFRFFVFCPFQFLKKKKIKKRALYGALSTPSSNASSP